jgi:uroporphyrinogen decarboxylase
MKAIVGYTGILENVMWLLGYEGISYLLYDDEALVADMFTAVGSRIVDYMRRCASHRMVGALQMGEDMGFKTQTLLPPEVYRKHLFPWHRRLVEAVHAEGKPIILHSCGNLAAIMEDVIDCGWDAKHSFEDGIMPVWEAKERWGDRIAILGGFDVHRIATSSPEQVREHTRFLIRRCAPGGGWALGTGNSVANYIPLANFFAMLDEGRRAGRRGA